MACGPRDYLGGLHVRRNERRIDLILDKVEMIMSFVIVEYLRKLIMFFFFFLNRTQG